MKALLYISDPYEPAGVIGLFETEKQKQNILLQHRKEWEETDFPNYKKEDNFCQNLPLIERLRKAEEDYLFIVHSLQEIEIPVGEYGQYF